jgi:putative acetyltransferase
MYHIRPIRPEDDPFIARIILQVMSGYRADPHTTIAGDPSLHHMYQNYQEAKAAYFVAEEAGKILGGCGIRQLAGGDAHTCELQRMFLLPEARKRGIGKALMQLCLEKAQAFGYRQVYIETLEEMLAARSLYLRFGFREIEQRLGDTGHDGCNIKMLKVINQDQPVTEK